MTLLLIARWTLNLQNLITIKHLENMNKIILVTGSIVGYAYCMRVLHRLVQRQHLRALHVPESRLRSVLVGGLVDVHLQRLHPAAVLVQEACARNLWVMFIISITINIGMWFERFVIIATSLTRDFLPSSWGYFSPTWVDICTFIGTIGLFLTLFLLFARFLPMIAMSEVKGVWPSQETTIHAGQRRESSPNEPQILIASHRSDQRQAGHRRRQSLRGHGRVRRARGSGRGRPQDSRTWATPRSTR